MGASLANRSAFMVPWLVSIVALYFLARSICMAGGAGYDFDAADTGAPWAAGEAAGEAALGMASVTGGTGLAAAGLAVGFGVAATCSVCDAVGPHAASASMRLRTRLVR